MKAILTLPSVFFGVILALSLLPDSFYCSDGECSFTLLGGTAQPADVFLIGASGDGSLIFSRRISYVDPIPARESIRFGRGDMHPWISGKNYNIWVFVYPPGGFKTSPAGFSFISPQSATYST